MTVELACRLLESKMLLRTEVAAALLDASTRGIALVQSLAERIPGAPGILEAEFSRWSGPLRTSLDVDVELVRELPLGMCERLLALPLSGRDATGKLQLAVVDPFDRHACSEFEYCLSTVVTPVRVAYAVLVQALDAIRTNSNQSFDVLLDVADDETPAFGTRMVRITRRPPKERTGRETTAQVVPNADGSRHDDKPDAPLPVTPPLGITGSTVRRGFTLPSLDAPEPTSDLPIPLVRTTLAPTFDRSGPVADRTPLPGTAVRDSEPVLRLVKQKPSLPARRVSVPAPPRFAQQGLERPEDLLEAIDQADTPRRLLELVRDALVRLASCQAYFSVRSGRYSLEWATGTERTGKTVLTNEQEAMLGKACLAGYFLGPLPPDGAQRALGATLGLRAREEVYVVPVHVAHRAALVIVVGRFDEAFAVTRWVDSVAKQASQVLERLARHRK